MLTRLAAVVINTTLARSMSDHAHYKVPKPLLQRNALDIKNDCEVRCERGSTQVAVSRHGAGGGGRLCPDLSTRNAPLTPEIRNCNPTCD
ncbi:hypothetical protein EVAR_52816_1 [Eumeta japonica]|uniref:Uncharacterized protein n=1 Tax=Eumeta variegata TaxID=151549 RepID=A0A4C2A3I4_EUMVA|nr:hypothetical protein EVAR_52816_1 [Eumeta japonica]